MSYNESLKKINAALDQALDDLDDEDELEDLPPYTPPRANSATPRSSSTRSSPKGTPDRIAVETVDEETEGDEDYKETVKELSNLMQDLMKDMQGNAPNSNNGDVDATISHLVSQLSNESRNRQVDTSPNASEEDLLQDLINQLGGMGDMSDLGDFNADAMIDGMMKEMVSKQLMYEPMKQVTDRFPAWLESTYMSTEERERREKQYMCFQELVLTYENDERNTKKLMELMQKAQEFGQPPTDIIKEIAPDLKLNDDGTPVLGESGLPFGDGDCVIM